MYQMNLLLAGQKLSVAKLMAATVTVAAVAGVGCLRRCRLFLRPCGLLPQLRARARRAFKTYSICLVAERSYSCCCCCCLIYSLRRINTLIGGNVPSLSLSLQLCGYIRISSRLPISISFAHSVANEQRTIEV